MLCRFWLLVSGHAGRAAGLIFFHMLLVLWWFGVRCLHMARLLDRRQVSPFFTCAWLRGDLLLDVCTYWLVCVR